MHQVTLSGYFIAQHETTFGDWIEYLNALPAKERKQRTPNVARGALGGSVELKESNTRQWTLIIQPQAERLSASEGKFIHYPNRSIRNNQNWLKFPVSGISFEDAESDVNWLNYSKKLPGARLCTEHEWEHAAKGADEREYPHGDVLEPDDANIDETYHKAPASTGPDEVGSHPLSRSPFGIDDLIGNHWEVTTSSLGANEAAARGGSFFFETVTCRSSNRMIVEPAFRSNDVSLRVCISLSDIR
jgi:formylglycine-generating enzyme required for sulfatase activity